MNCYIEIYFVDQIKKFNSRTTYFYDDFPCSDASRSWEDCNAIFKNFENLDKN